MKHHYTDEQMQAAIDEAFNKAPIPRVIHTVKGGAFWEDQKAHRLHLLKSALALLPDPTPPVVDGRTPGQVACEAWNNGHAWKETNYKAEWERSAAAVLAAFGNKQAHPQLSTLHPIAEAGDVTAGCVRIRGYKEKQGEWHLATWVNSDDTHFADIRLPESKEEKPVPAQPWTPEVGDVVTLKSGGPKMTVHELFPEENRVICYYYKKGRLETPTFATATLQPA